MNWTHRGILQRCEYRRLYGYYHRGQIKRRASRNRRSAAPRPMFWRNLGLLIHIKDRRSKSEHPTATLFHKPAPPLLLNQEISPPPSPPPPYFKPQNNRRNDRPPHPPAPIHTTTTHLPLSPHQPPITYRPRPRFLQHRFHHCKRGIIKLEN